MKKLLAFYSVLSLLITTPLFAEDKGWKVSVDTSNNQVIESVYGDGVLSHTGAGFKTASGIPSSFMESADRNHLKWVDSNSNGTIESAEIVAMTSGEITAKDALTVRSAAKSCLDTFTASPLEQRAFASVAVDEINLLRDWITSFKAAVAASTSLADLKTRVAALDSMPDRTLTQLKTAIKSRIDDGTAD